MNSEELRARRPYWKTASVVGVILLAGALYFHFRLERLPKAALKPPPKVVVCIDPGHPSESNSGRGVQNGTSELKINWLVSEQLATVLSKDPRITVIMTRKHMDEYMRNRQRALTANDARAALAIHLHCDAGPSHGFTVYYPDKEGHSEGKAGPSVEVLKSSYSAALAVDKGMRSILCPRLKDRGTRGEKFTRIGRINGGLTTSVWSEVPTVTVEMVFLSNRYDATFIKTEAGQKAMAEGLAKGVKEFIRPELRAYEAAVRRYRRTSEG